MKNKDNQSTSNEKRLQSLKTLKKNYHNQKLIIQSALSNIDKVGNKTVFDEDLEEKLSNIPKTVKKGQTLFEDNSDDDNFEVDFSVKKQYEGEEGQKLLELQSRYKNDKRFVLNERFLDDPVEKLEAENGFNQNEDEEMSLENEKKREFKILDQVLQKHSIKPKLKEKNAEGEKKFMVRFDPSQPQHSKYELKKEEVQTKKNKKNKMKQIPDILENKKSEETEAPEVSKTIFYEVKGNLKDTLHKNNQVSLLSMFGNTNEHGTDDLVEKAEEKEIRITKSSLTSDNNPFKYDSSDDDEHDISNKPPQPVNGVSEYEEISNTRTNFWVEPFFFKEDDYRLQEGFDFIEKMKMEDKSEFTKSRRELKGIVRMKIRNVQQKKKLFKRKLGGSKRRKDIRMKKALKK